MIRGPPHVSVDVDLPGRRSAISRAALAGGLGVLVICLMAIPQDAERAALRHGRRYEVRSFVTPTAFTRRCVRRRRLDSGEFARSLSRSRLAWLRVPCGRVESLPVMGDTGTGKSAHPSAPAAGAGTRGDRDRLRPGTRVHAAVLRPGPRDAILNPLDRRTPFWTPATSSASARGAHARGISVSRTPERELVFSDAPRRIMAFFC